MALDAEKLGMSTFHEEWLQDNNLTAVRDNEALQTWATELRSPIGEDPRVYLSEIDLASDGDNLMVNWRAPFEPYDGTKHQAQLTNEVGLTLLKIKNEALRRTINMWGVVTMIGGAAIGAVGERYVQNDVMHVGGWILAGLGTVALGWANTRGEPKPPVLTGAAPVRLEPKAG